MTNRPVAIDPFLAAFVSAYARGRPAPELARTAYLDALLRRCIEETGPGLLCSDCRTLLELERVFDPTGACARVMRLECLVIVLVHFVHQPWLRSDPLVRIAQWSFVDHLLAAVEATPLPATKEISVALRSLHSHLDRALRGGR